MWRQWVSQTSNRVRHGAAEAATPLAKAYARDVRNEPRANVEKSLEHGRLIKSTNNRRKVDRLQNL